MTSGIWWWDPSKWMKPNRPYTHSFGFVLFSFSSNGASKIIIYYTFLCAGGGGGGAAVSCRYRNFYVHVHSCQRTHTHRTTYVQCTCKLIIVWNQVIFQRIRCDSTRKMLMFCGQLYKMRLFSKAWVEKRIWRKKHGQFIVCSTLCARA